ncbi:hypothetical protein GCM10020219_069980 [Nonomuraea dietziae]
MSQGRANLSGGQRQRLSIARALCGGPRSTCSTILFSALDRDRADGAGGRARRRDRGRGGVIVAQRFDAVRDADRVVAWERAWWWARGTHAELLRTCPTYQRSRCPRRRV